jgi:hypothetical protein
VSADVHIALDDFACHPEGQIVLKARLDFARDAYGRSNIRRPGSDDLDADLLPGGRLAGIAATQYGNTEQDKTAAEARPLQIPLLSSIHPHHSNLPTLAVYPPCSTMCSMAFGVSSRTDFRSM